MAKALFSTPVVVSTPGAISLLERHGKQAQEFLARHFSGDWGTLDPSDSAQNTQSIKTKGMILSSYSLQNGKVWVITDPGHGVTTVLLPEEY